MKTVPEICRLLAEGEFEFTRHAFRRAIERNIASHEIREAGAAAVLIEDYPDDKYSPSGLLLGFTSAGRPLHLQVSFAQNPVAKLITVYEPDPAEWIEYRLRK